MFTTTYYQKLRHFAVVIEYFDGKIGTDVCLLASKVTELMGLQCNPTINYALGVMDQAKQIAPKNICHVSSLLV